MSEPKLSDRRHKITLDIELPDLLDAVSKAKGPPISPITQHSVEAEDLKKAWFNYVLLNIEKLADSLERVRREDLVNIKKELKEEVDKVEEKVNKNREVLEAYKKEVMEPINNRLLVLTTKLGVWSLVAGFVGSGAMGLIMWGLKLLVSSAAPSIPLP